MYLRKSHSPTEAEIISLDTGLRMDGIPALDLWSLVIKCFILPQTNSTTPKIKYEETRRVTPRQTSTHNQTKVPTQHDNFDLNDVDYVPSNATFSRIGAMLYFEDNEAVIKMIIKGRSPTMRQLLDRISLDPKIQIKYIDTKNQLADMLTKEISHVTNGTIFFICSSLISCTERMAKRMEEQKEGNRIEAKSRPSAMTLVSSVPTSSSSVNSPIASRTGAQASCRQVGLSGRPGASANQNSNPDAASSSRGWQRDAHLFISTGGPVATGKDQKSPNRQEKSIVSTGEPAATGYQGYPENPETPEDCFRRFRTRKSTLATPLQCITR